MILRETDAKISFRSVSLDFAGPTNLAQAISLRQGGPMCPVCVATTAALLAGSTAGSGGLAAIVIGWFRRKK
jgi:hypothetical protein